MDNTQGLNKVITDVRACKNPTEATRSLVDGLGELVKEAARSGDPTVNCEDLGAAIQARATDISSAVGQVAAEYQRQTEGQRA
jgi:hypothetical protein